MQTYQTISGKLHYLQGATKNDHETVQLILLRGSNGVNKPVNCEVIRSSPLQDSTFIRSADTNILQQKTISAPTSGPPEPPSTTCLCAPVSQFFTLLNIVYFVVGLLVYLGTKEVSLYFQSERLDFQTTVEHTSTELGDSWADKIRSSIAFS